MATSLFPFKKTSKRRTAGASEHVARIGWLLLRLLMDRTVEYAAYRDRFGCSTRGFQRDLCKLREIGQGAFTISRSKSGRAILTTQKRALSDLSARSSDAAETLARIAAALGGPLASAMVADSQSASVAADMHSGFFHVREPVPSSDRLTNVFEFLRNAAAGPARVEFAYQAARGPRSMRRVEPYHVVVRSGRYYLIAYDLLRKDWRYFALDAIEGWTLRKEGTFTPRAVPPRFLAQRAVGWIRADSGDEDLDVTIRVNPVAAGAVRARKWQNEQRIMELPDGGVEITLAFADAAEAVRWSLQFGAEAVLVAPPQAVGLAREIAEQIVRAYGKLRQTGVARAV